MDAHPRRRYVILAEGQFGETASKTAIGVIRYARDTVVAIIDSTRAGRNVSEWLGPTYDIPVVSTLDEVLPLSPTSLLLGTAPVGGRIPQAWRDTIMGAITSGLDVISGLHEFVTDDAEFTSAAATHGVSLVDHRKPPERHEVATGRPHAPGKQVVLTVGSDCAIGKMTVSVELRRAAVAAGLDALMVPTGQTGIMIEGWGVAVDRVISDFVAGTVEWLVAQAEEMGDFIIVEGQGSIDHPSYSGVTLGLLHGSAPHALVMVHEPGRTLHHGWEERSDQPNAHLKPLSELISVYEVLAGLVAPAKVMGIALNTSALDEGEARREIARVQAETGIVTDDVVRFGGERIVDALRAGMADLGMRLDLSSELFTLPFRDPFRIARAEDHRTATTVVHDLTTSGGLTGVGESFPVAYYGETTGTVGAVLPLLAEALEGLGDPPSGVAEARAWLTQASAAMAARIGGHGSAKAGLDIALHDLVARGMGIPLWQLLGTSPDLPPTDFTLGIDRPDEVAARAQRASRFPALKIKVGGPADLETLEAVRSVYGGALRVDANTGWQPEAGAALIPELVRLGVELIEQPFPAHQLAQLRWLQDRSSLPIVADESCVGIDDLEGLVGVVAAVNVKIMKCGGVGPGLAMIRRARELGFKVFLGCMEETSVAIAAAAALASLADWVDLDGNLLLARDPFEGIVLGQDCRWQLSTESGLGVHRRLD